MIDWIGCKLTKCPYGKEYGNCDTCENLIRKEDIVEPCDFCECHEKGDTLYEATSWDGGISFDYIRNIKYCPLCGKELEGVEWD